MSDALADADGLVALTEHLYAYPDTCNAYAVVDGDAALVVDPGSGVILEALEAVVDDVAWALHTHHHRDQCWGTWRLAEAGARVAVPEHERHLFDDVETFWERKRIYDNYNDRSTFDTLPESVPVDATLEDYETFEWGDYAFEVLPAKGHTFGSSALLVGVDGRRVAFSGDLIHEGGRLHQLHQLEYEYGDMKGVPFTIQSIRALDREDPDLVLPSHGPVIDDPGRDVERLQRRLMDVVDLGRGLNAGTRAYLPEMGMIEVSEHLLWGGPWTCSNFYVVRSDSGKALFVDYGHSMSQHMHVGSDREEMETMRFVAHHLDELRTEHGIDEFDLVVPTHVHDDHTCGIPHLQRHYDVDCWALEEVGQVLDDPAAWASTPCTFPEPIDIDRWLEDGERFEWAEFEFEVRHAPGQTEFHSVLAAEIDGRDVAFTGDNYFEHDVDVHYDRRASRPFQTTVFRNSFQFDMHRRCVAVMEELAPDRICPGHGEVLDTDETRINTYADFVARKERVFRELAADPADHAVDLFWARLLPYRAAPAPGETVPYRLLLRNDFDGKRTYEARLYAPDGRTTVAGGTTALSPGERTELHLPVEAGEWGPGRAVITGEVLVDGDSRGPVVEALIEVGEETTVR